MGFFDKLKPPKKLTAAISKAAPTINKALSGGNVFKGTPFEKVAAAAGKAATAAADSATGGQASSAIKTITSTYNTAKGVSDSVRGALGSVSKATGVNVDNIGALVSKSPAVGPRGTAPGQAKASNSIAAAGGGDASRDSGKQPNWLDPLFEFIRSLFGG